MREASFRSAAIVIAALALGACDDGAGGGSDAGDFTLYALSEAPAFPVPPEEVSGPIVTESIADITLASAAISASYTRVDAGAD